MTRMTVDSLGRQSVTATLTKLDGEHGRAESRWEHDLFRGPFGVLKLSPSVASPSGHNASQPDPAESSRADWDFLWSSLDSIPTIAEDNHLFGGLYDIAEDVEDVPRADLPLGADPFPNNLEVPLPDPLGIIFDEFLGQQTPLPISPIPHPSLVLSRSKYVPLQAPELLRYFKENIISLSFPLKNCRKCPWQTIHLPTAMSTYAELSIHQTASHTRLSLFYSLLAASCLHMFSRNPNTVDLNRSSKGFTQLAKQHLEVALNEEVLGSRRAKYKELLMAVLSMAMLSVCSPFFFPRRTTPLMKCRYSTEKILMLKASWSTRSISFAYEGCPSLTSHSKSAPFIMSTRTYVSWLRARAAAHSLIYAPTVLVPVYWQLNLLLSP